MDHDKYDNMETSAQMAVDDAPGFYKCPKRLAYLRKYATDIDPIWFVQRFFKFEKGVVENFHLGDIVQVRSRCRPGENKEGGSGRIIELHPDYYFTVKYFTGRKEKKVDGNFCILEDFGDNKPRPSVKRCDGCKAFETECLCKLYHNADDRTVEEEDEALRQAVKDSLKEKSQREKIFGNQSMTSDEERSPAPKVHYNDVFSEDSSPSDPEADSSDESVKEADEDKFSDESVKEADEDKENREYQMPSRGKKRQRNKSFDLSDQPADHRTKIGKGGVGNGSVVMNEGSRVFQVDWRLPEDEDEDEYGDDFIMKEGETEAPTVNAAMRKIGIQDLKRKGGDEREKCSRFNDFVEQIRNTELPAYQRVCKRLLKRIHASRSRNTEEEYRLVDRLHEQMKRFQNWSVDVMDAVRRRYDVSSTELRLELKDFDKEIRTSIRTSVWPDDLFSDAGQSDEEDYLFSDAGQSEEDLSTHQEMSDFFSSMQPREQSFRNKRPAHDVLYKKRKDQTQRNPGKAPKRQGGLVERRGNRGNNVTGGRKVDPPKRPRRFVGRSEHVNFRKEQESASFDEEADDHGESRNEGCGPSHHDVIRPYKDSIFPTYVDDLGDEEIKRYYASLPRPPLGIDKVREVHLEPAENLFGDLRAINETWISGGACSVIEAVLKAMRLEVFRLAEKATINISDCLGVFKGLEAVSVHIRNYGHEYLSSEAEAFYAIMKLEVVSLESKICPKGFSPRHCEGSSQSDFEIILLWYLIDWCAGLEEIFPTAWSFEAGPSHGVLYPLLKSVLLRLIRTYFAYSTPRKSSVLSLTIEPDNFEDQPKELPMLGRLWFKVFREADAYLRGHGVQEGFWYLFSECMCIFNIDQEARCNCGSHVPQDKWVSLASFLRGSFEKTENLWKLVIELLRINFMVRTRTQTNYQLVPIGCWDLLECLLSSSPFERGFQNLIPNHEKAWMQARSDISIEAYKAAIIRRVEVFLLHWGGKGKLVLKLWEAGITDSCERLEKSQLPFQRKDEAETVRNCYTWLLEKLKGSGSELRNLTSEGLHHLFWDVADPSRWLISASLLIPPPSLLQRLPHKDAISKIANKGCDEVLFLLAWLASKQLGLMERKDRKNFVMEVVKRIKAPAKEDGVVRKGSPEQYPMACLHNIILAILMLGKANSAEDTLLVNVWRQLLIPEKEKYSQSQSMLAVQMLAYLYQDGEANSSFFSIESVLEKLLKCLLHEAARPKAEFDEDMKTIARDSIQRRWIIFFGILAITLLRHKAPIGHRNCPKFFQMIEAFLQDFHSLDDATLAISLWAFRSFFPLQRVHHADLSCFLLLLTFDQKKLPGPLVEWPLELPAAHYQQIIHANFLDPGKLVSSLSILFQKTYNSLKFTEQQTGMINYGNHVVQILDCLAGMNLLLSSAGRSRDGFDVKTSLSCKFCFSDPGSVLRLFPACYNACAFQYAVPRSHLLQDEKNTANLVDTWLCLAMDPSIVSKTNIRSGPTTVAVFSDVQDFLVGEFWPFTRKLSSLLLQTNEEFAYLFDLARVQEWLHQPIIFSEEDAHIKDFKEMLSCRLVMLVNAFRQLAKKAVGPPGSINRKKAKELFDGTFLKYLHHVLEKKVKKSPTGQTALEKEKRKAYIEFFYAFAGMLLRVLGETVQQQQSAIALVEALFSGWIKKTEDPTQLSRENPFYFRYSAFYLGDFVRFCALCRYSNGKAKDWVDQLIRRVLLQGFLPNSMRIEVLNALCIGLWSVWRPPPSPSFSSPLYVDSASAFSKLSFFLKPSADELGTLQSNAQTKLETFRRQIIHDLNLASNLKQSSAKPLLNFLSCFLSKTCRGGCSDDVLSFQFDLLPILEPVMALLASLLGSPETHLAFAVSQVIQNLLTCNILESQRQVVDSRNHGPELIAELIKAFLEYLSNIVSLRKELISKGYVSNAHKALAESLVQNRQKFINIHASFVQDMKRLPIWEVKADGVKLEDQSGASAWGTFTKEHPLLFNQDTSNEESCLTDLDYLLVRETYGHS